MASDVDAAGDADGLATAWRHIEEAKVLRSELARTWTELCEAESFSGRTLLSAGRTRGAIWVEVAWPSDLRNRAEEQASGFIRNVRSAFGLALRAAAGASGSAVDLDPDDYSMPILESVGEFEAHVQEKLQGLRPDQVQMVRFFQPFPQVNRRSRLSDEVSRVMMQLKNAIKLEESGAESGPLISVWAHSAYPEVYTDPPRVISDLVCNEDCNLEDEVEVATFSVPDANPDDSISASPNVAFDMILGVPPWPNDPDDNFSGRSALLIALVSEFVRGCERSVGLREPVADDFDSIAAVELSEERHKWAPLDTSDGSLREVVRDVMSSSDIGLAVYRDDEGKLVLLVKGPDSEIYGRPVPMPSDLDSTAARGTAAEGATLSAAEIWGLPDFVLYPKRIATASRNREIGDGTIVVGRRGLALQVKSREVPGGEADREVSWIKKKIAKAARQASGTIRAIGMQGASLMNGRGRMISLDGRTIEWTRVVIVDHDAPPSGVTPEFDSTDPPVVAIMRRDWEFLFDQLRSVTAVADYLYRVAREDPCALGDEPVRYFELADADELATSEGSREWLEGLEGEHFSYPQLPKAPASSSDAVGHAIFRILLDDIAESSFGEAEDDRLKVLSLLDRFSVGARAELGRLLLRHLDEVSGAPQGTTLWKFRWVIQDAGTLQLGFGACSQLTESHHEAFRQRVMIKHHDFLEGRGGSMQDECWTVAVLLTPRRDRLRQWDTTLMAMNGPSGLTGEDVDAMRALWNQEAS